MKTISKIFKNFSYAESLLFNLPDPPNKSNLESVVCYFLNLEKTFLNTEIIKAASSIDELSGRFLKDDAEILTKPIS